MLRLLLLCLFPSLLWAQQDTVPPMLMDTIRGVEVNAYGSPEPLESATNSIGVLSPTDFDRQANNTSFVSVLNLVPGVRMEERSPGSYRLSTRGSLLRSPFGIRNIKIYLMGELPLTDASGNTYLNLIDFAGVYSADIIKGPDASNFGANSGGVMVFYPNKPPRDTALHFHLAAGSFGLVKEDFGFKKVWNKYSIQFTQAYQRTDGYRRNSQMQRHFLQAIQQWSYRPKVHVSFYHLFSNLQYETPGGLTLAQMQADRTAARAPTATLPGASQQQAGIFNTTTYHGLIHEWTIKNQLRHVVSAWGSYTDFKNPFITNYEVRKEHTLGARTFIEWKGPRDKKWFDWISGYEFLYTFTDFKNYGNNGGTRDTLQVADKLKAQQQYIFTRFNKTLWSLWRIDASLSLNFFDYRYQNGYPIASESYERIQFNPQWMPRIGTSVEVWEGLFIRGSISRGYSPPTLGEVRPSTNIISAGLQAESGWNYEAGLSYTYRKRKLDLTLKPTFYYFRLGQAIVRREDANGAEYFINSGGTNQKGLEMTANLNWNPHNKKGITQISAYAAYTYQHFRFSQYQVGNEDYSGNWLTGVPRHGVVAMVSVYVWYKLDVNLSYTYTSAIPLNDANDVYADGYHILQANISYELPIKKRSLTFYISGDNLLNQKYSLGNDINAFGGRYYNPAPTINFLGGVKLKI